MELDKNKMPKHIAIILDGNGRWAKKRLLPRTMGHRKGAFNVRDIARHAQELGVQYLTVFCFSTENWNRPKSEVEYIMTTPIRYFKRYKKDILNSKIRIKFIGTRDRISAELVKVFEEIENGTKDHKGLTLTLCVDYGSYDEITTAVKEIVKEIKAGKIKEDEIDAKLIENHLFTKDYPNLDLLIRTSREIRISNFLLWQLGYTELYFTDVLWPDFDSEELEKAIASFQKRNRRFGGLNDNK